MTTQDQHIMNKSKLLNILVLLLIITNLVVLAFYFFGKKKNHKFNQKRRNPQEIIIQQLAFDKAQQAEFKIIIEEHQTALKKYTSELHQTKNALFKSLGASPLNTDSLMDRINTCHLKIEETHFNHFLSIKKICKPEQLGAYNELSKNLARLFAPPGRPGKNHKH